MRMETVAFRDRVKIEARPDEIICRDSTIGGRRKERVGDVPDTRLVVTDTIGSIQPKTTMIANRERSYIFWLKRRQPALLVILE